MEESELRKYVIRGDRALACCKSAEAAVQLDISKVISSYLAAVLEIVSGRIGRGAVLALVPAPFAPRIVIGTIAALERASKVAAPALQIGFVVILEAAVVASLATATGALEAASGMATAIGQMLSERANTQNRCLDCMSKNVLSQAARRHRERVKILRRV